MRGVRGKIPGQCKKFVFVKPQRSGNFPEYLTGRETFAAFDAAEMGSDIRCCFISLPRSMAFSCIRKVV
jgi:hypothetical protein